MADQAKRQIVEQGLQAFIERGRPVPLEYGDDPFSECLLRSSPQIPALEDEVRAFMRDGVALLVQRIGCFQQNSSGTSIREKIAMKRPVACWEVKWNSM